jgi:hypothetical protein
MLKEKPQCDSIEEIIVPVVDGFEGPGTAYVETSSGKRYVYSAYALGAKTGTTTEIYLWSIILPTLRDILARSGFDDPVILWRERPNIERGEGKSYMSMRCVAVPRAELENIMPVEYPLDDGDILKRMVSV